MQSNPETSRLSVAGPLATGVLAAALAWLGVRVFPEAGIEIFARGAASLASLLTGAPILRVAEGWLLDAAQPVVVSEVCSATGYFVVVAALLASGQSGNAARLPVRIALALVAALPLTLAINAVRVVAVMHAHRWIIPHLPASWGAFLHLLAGVAVFLPALVGLNLALEFHGKSRPTR